MTHRDYCHNCNKSYEYEDIHDEKHHRFLLRHAIKLGHKFTSYQVGTEYGELHRKLARVP